MDWGAKHAPPAGLVKLGEAEGLPAVPIFELSLVSAAGEPSRVAVQLREFLEREVGRLE